MGGLRQQSFAASDGRDAKPNRLNHLRRYALPVLALAVVSILAGFEAARSHGAAKWGGADSVQAASLSESADATPLGIDDLRRLAPQQQAERLLDRAIHRDQGSLELIGK